MSLQLTIYELDLRRGWALYFGEEEVVGRWVCEDLDLVPTALELAAAAGYVAGGLRGWRDLACVVALAVMDETCRFAFAGLA